MIQPKVCWVSSFVALAIVWSAESATAQAKDQYHFKFMPQDGQELTWKRGVAAVDSEGAEAIVRVIDSMDSLPDDQTTFRITVLNIGEEPVEVSSENIWVEDASGTRVSMLDYEELAGRHRRDIKRRQALALFGGAMAAGSANGYTTGSFNYNGTTASGGHFSGFGTYTAYDPNLAAQQSQQAAAQNQATLNAIQIRQLGGIEALNGMLRQTTLKPGEMTSGIVAFDVPRNLRKSVEKEPVSIVAKIGSAEHRFQAKLIELP
ncbi:hypothetical protein [Blastomonas sp. UPD001]|uniref:hypothetical protein n=1 Tax=Blastomonas sp. UPD001 TaxID=2217673 RepID=UPI0013001C2F|nr:hypothetical protein [Blastomonas sp. UPD001]